MPGKHSRSRRPPMRPPTRTVPRGQPVPSATDHGIGLRAHEALRDLAKQDPKAVRSLFRDHPSVLSDLSLLAWQGRGRPKGSYRLLSKRDRKDVLIWRARALGLNGPQICRDLGRKYNSAARRYVRRAIRRVDSTEVFESAKAHIAEQCGTRKQIGAALRALSRNEHQPPSTTCRTPPEIR